MTTILRDLRYAVRTLAKRPGFSLAVILILALGIGANTAIFSLVDGVLLAAVPFVDAGELVDLRESTEGARESPVAYPNFLDFKARQRGIFTDLVAHRTSGVNLTVSGRPEHLESVWISEGMCRLLGVEPTLGRCFAESEDQPGAAGAVVLSWGFWQRRFGGDQGVLGHNVTLDDEPFEVVGVMPRGFVYPLARRHVDVWLPLGHFGDKYWMENRGSRPGISITARLAPGVGLAAARADMERVAGELAAEYPESNAKRGVALMALRERVVRNVRPMILVLWGAVALVLLIACVNVANLLLARGTGRGREMAVRRALGAGHREIARQPLAESLVLALAGGALGIGVARAALEGLPKLFDLSVFSALGLDTRVLVFNLALSLTTGLVFGLLPAVQAARGDMIAGLKDGTRGAGGDGASRARSLLVIAETALALVLMIGAVLFLRSFASLLSADPGFDAEGVFTFHVSLSEKAYGEAAEQSLFFERLLERVTSLPGVDRAAATMPLLGGWSQGFLVDGQARDPSTFLALPLVLVTVALAACVVPARRANRHEPVRSLRYE